MSGLIELPQFSAIFSPGICSVPVVLVGGGRAPQNDWLLKLCEGRTTWAIDSGIDVCMSAGLLPEVFIGDRDSASREGILWAEKYSVTSFFFPPEKDYTDLQLALKLIKIHAPEKDVILTGSFGGRLDHSLANIFSLIWGYEEWGVRTRCIADDKETLFLVKGKEKVIFSGVGSCAKISTLALSEKCSGINLLGTRWPMVNSKIFKNRPFAISNYILFDKNDLFPDMKGAFSVEIDQGYLGVYITTEMENGKKG